MYKYTTATKERNTAQSAPVSFIVTILTLLVLVAPFLLRPYAVTGGSMEPTYSEGDIVIVEKLTHHFLLSKGDVLIMRNPHNHEIVEIKRVYGLPGERVEVDGFSMQLGPEDYFVLGDNRAKSSDSRAFGAVQRSDIIGKVLFRK